MINLFRRLNPVNVLVLIILAVILRLGILLNPPQQLNFSLFESYAYVLIDLDTNSLFSVQANLMIALVLTLVQAMLFNRVVNAHNLLGKPSFLPALMYVTGSSLLVHFLVLTPALICNFLMIWMLDKFLSTHRKASAQASMFDLGVIVALGTMIYLPFLAMMLLLWLCLMVFRPFNWREWIAGIIGFATIYFFLAVAYIWTDSFDEFRNLQVPLALEFKFFKINIYNYLVVIPLLLIMFLSVISLQQKLYRSNVHIRKSYLLLFFILVVSFLSFFITLRYQVYHFLIAVPAASVFMSYYFISATKRWFYESLYLILVGFIIYFQWT